MPDAELPPDVATVDTAAEPALTAFSDEDAASDVLSDAAELFPETAASLQPARLSAVMPAMAQRLIILVFIRIFYLPPDDVNKFPLPQGRSLPLPLFTVIGNGESRRRG